MTRASSIAAVVAAVLIAACSKTETQANVGNSNAPPTLESANLTAQSLDYKMICERLMTLAPEARKGLLAGSCMADYQKMLPSCQNTSAVNTCYANLKEWSGRLTCLDSCVRK